MELFRRVAGGLALTEAGERLLPSAEEILASLRQLRGELKEAERHRYSRLRMALPAQDCRSTSGRSWMS